MGQGAQRTPGALETRQRAPPVGEDVDQFGVERVGGRDPLAVAGLPVGGGDGVAERLVGVGVGVDGLAALPDVADASEQPTVEDREDVVSLDRGNDVLGAADHLGEPLLHLFAGEAGVVLQVGAGERGDHRGGRHGRRRGAQLLDERQRRRGQVALVGRDGQGLGQVLEGFVEQDQAGRVGLEERGQLGGR